MVSLRKPKENRDDRKIRDSAVQSNSKLAVQMPMSVTLESVSSIRTRRVNHVVRLRRSELYRPRWVEEKRVKRARKSGGIWLLLDADFSLRTSSDYIRVADSLLAL